LLKVKSPLWEFLDAPTPTSKAAGDQLITEELLSIHAEGKPALELMKNPAALYMEGFRSAKDLQKHMEALSDEQRKVLSQFDEIERAGAIPLEEVEEFQTEIERTIGEMYEGANEAHDVEAVGAYRRGDAEIKEVDILVTRKDEGPTRYLLLKLVEMLEDKGIILQQIKEIRVTSNGSAGF
jgi:DNA polymerase/3'-5' exonuclease PolX